jgi:energy-coupling factor transport system ATP-binding protein
VDLQLKKGSFHALIGPTGSGKSTLVQILGGLQKPERGHVFLEGEDIYGQSFSKKKLRSRLGLVFQYAEYQLFETTVLRDVAFGPGNLGFSEEEAREKAIQGLKAAGVEVRFWEQSPFELSGGEKRRVAIVIFFVVAMFLTPPDPMSQLIMAIPLCLLYEVSIWAVWLLEKGFFSKRLQNN